MAKRVTHKSTWKRGFTGSWYWTSCRKYVEVGLAKRRWKDVRCKACLKRKPKARAP